MAYIGNDLEVAFQSYLIIDDISSSFNGSVTSFALQVGGAAPVPLPINPQQCLISVAGVIQEPDPTGASGFNLSGGNIVFSSAPSGGASFFGVILAGADYVKFQSYNLNCLKKTDLWTLQSLKLCDAIILLLPSFSNCQLFSPDFSNSKRRSFLIKFKNKEFRYFVVG